MMPLASRALTRRRQADGDIATASARSTFAIRPSSCSVFRGPGEADAQAIIAGLLLLVVLALAAGGLRSSATAQLLLVALLIVVVTVAVSGSARMARAANWAPFAPHGWAAVGHAAALLMLSFVGWEAVAPLTTRFR